MENRTGSTIPQTPNRNPRGMARLRQSLALAASVALFCALLCELGMAQQTVVLVGAGSTVPLPLYKRWMQEYNQRNPKIQLEYLPLGTSEGLKQISGGKADFGAGEAPLGTADTRQTGMIQIPTALIGIVPIYNLPEVHGELRFSGEVLAEIYLGEIKSWNAPQIARLNPNLQLPALPIKVVYRPGGKGSNYVLTEFLSKTNAAFRSRVGSSLSPHWPVGAAAERSSDMADKVRSEPGSIGYVELQYAVKNRISFATVLNPAGRFVRASAETLTSACNAAEGPRWNNLSASLTNAAGAESYPIASFTWMYLRAASADHGRAAGLADLLNWTMTEGQQFAVQEGYARLPQPLVEAARAKIKSLR